MIRSALVLAVALVPLTLAAQDRETKVRGDRQRVANFGDWVYNDLPSALDIAKRSGKPILVTLRCVPCEACAQLDEQVIERDPTIRDLMDQFVCVRIIQANGLDLSLFQYDYDQSWTAFFLHADLTIYGRYGTRSHQTRSEDDVSLEGFAASMKAALALHQDFAQVREALQAKRGPKPEFRVPEQFPSLRGRYKATLDFKGKVVQSCIHCHQIGEARRLVYRTSGKPIPDQLLYPYPNPKVLGLVMDPKQAIRVREVVTGSSAAQDGFLAGDDLIQLDGQPLVSTADIQWVLHHASESGTLKAVVRRDGKLVDLNLTLNEGWRRRDNIGWRVSSWDLRRMVTGGLLLEELPAAERSKAGLGVSRLALRVKHVGQYAPHDFAKKAGVINGDILVAVNGHREAMSESDLLAMLARETRPGEQVTFTMLRNGQQRDVKLRMQ